MDEIFDKKKRSDVDLTNFDLTDFKEYFDEEDAQREAEIKETQKSQSKLKEDAAHPAESKSDSKNQTESKKTTECPSDTKKDKKNQIEDNTEEIRIEQEKLRQKIAQAKKLSEKNAIDKKSDLETREKEEAHRAAEKAAAAVLAAKKAEEARIKEQQEISARLLEQADVDNSSNIESTSEKGIKEDAENKEIKFSDVSAILDIENQPSPSIRLPQDDEDFEDDKYEFSEDSADKNKKKSIIFTFTVICIILGVATVVCATLAVLNFLKSADDLNNSTDTAVKAIQSYNPYSDLKISYNNVKYPNSINHKLKAMYSENNDIVGWLTINGTAIDYPIMQDNNNKYYLYNHNAYNESARYGTPFLDFRCNKFNLSKNTIVYGHHMNNNAHFGSLDGYTDPDYFKKHPIIRYDTLTSSYSFKVYAVFYATTQSSVDDGYVFDYYNPNMSSSNFKGYIQMLNQYALYTTEAGLREDDKIITLSTCTHVYDNLKKGGVDARLVVVGRLLRNGESENMNTNNILVNSDYRRPQLWYDKHDKKNPYASYRSWEPSTR